MPPRPISRRMVYFPANKKPGSQVVLVDGLAFSLAGDDVFDFGGYDLRLEGLFDVVFGTLGVGFEDAFFVADGGQKEDGDIFPKLALEEALMEMEAVFTRHHHVKKDDIDGVAVEQGNRFVSVLCAKDRHTVLMESQLAGSSGYLRHHRPQARNLWDVQERAAVVCRGGMPQRRRWGLW